MAIKWKELGQGEGDTTEDGTLQYEGSIDGAVVYHIRCKWDNQVPWSLIHILTDKKWTKDFWSSCQAIAKNWQRYLDTNGQCDKNF
jgi:hypothetical protein